MSRKVDDLVGQVFYELTVIERTRDKNNKPIWKCKCSCGKETYVTTAHLKSGHTKSCGHLHTDRSGINHPNFKGNNYVVDNGLAVGTDRKGVSFKIDLSDLENVSKYCWLGVESRKSTKGYYFSARMSRKSPEGHKMKMLHNFIWEIHNGEIPDGYRVDHKNQDPQDNRLSNLRLATRNENAMNIPTPSNNTSGITGVSWSKKEDKWRSYITFNKERIELGRFQNKDEAIKARLEAERKYFKEFAPQKHLYKQYGIEDDE